MTAAMRVTVEDLGDATAELLAFLFVARGLDPRGMADLSVLRDRLGALDDGTNPGPRRRQVEPWRLLAARSEALRAHLGAEDSQERRLHERLERLEGLVGERILLEARRPRWLASTDWHVDRRELESRIEDQLGGVISAVGVLARWLAWNQAQ